MILLAWTAAVAAAFGYGGGSVLQAVGASRSSGPATLRHPVYLSGLLCDGLAWLASLVALRALPLFVVQSVLASSVAVTVLLARLTLGSRLRRRDIAAILGLVAALVALAALFVPGRASTPSGFTAWALGGLALVTIGLALGYRAGGSLPLALLAGTAYAGTAVAARGLDLSGGPAETLAQPLAWALVGYGVVGTLAYARSLERGPVGPATAMLWAVEAVAGGVVGVAVLGDMVRPGWAVPALAAVAVTLACCLLLATSPAERVLETSP